VAGYKVNFVTRSIKRQYTFFTLLVKPSGAACNLACEYCFYLSKERLYPSSNMRMSEHVLETYIKQLLASQKTPEINVSWQGGEPTLMGLEFFKHSVELVERYRKPGQNVAYSLQTNGTQLDDKWCAFFKKHNFLVGLSMDGPGEIHNTYRVNKAGQGSFHLVKRGWELLRKHQVDINILCAVHAANQEHALDVYRFFRDNLNARFIQFIPIVERLGMKGLVREQVDLQEQINNVINPGYGTLPAVSQRSVNPKQFGKFLADIFDEWIQHDVGRVFIQTFESALASWCHLPASVCTFQEVCGTSLILEHNGDLYSCDHFVEPEYRLGNILEHPMIELINSTKQQGFGLEKRAGLPEDCRNCDVLFACHGECPRNRFVQTPNRQYFTNYLCPGYKLFFHHIDQPIRRMADLLLHGRPAADIMRIKRESRACQSTSPTGDT
jgi:uncharacterized protein